MPALLGQFIAILLLSNWSLTWLSDSYSCNPFSACYKSKFSKYQSDHADIDLDWFPSPTGQMWGTQNPLCTGCPDFSRQFYLQLYSCDMLVSFQFQLLCQASFLVSSVPLLTLLRGPLPNYIQLQHLFICHHCAEKVLVLPQSTSPSLDTYCIRTCFYHSTCNTLLCLFLCVWIQLLKNRHQEKFTMLNRTLYSWKVPNNEGS